MTVFGRIDETSTETEIQDLLDEIQSSFSEEQKKGILASLMRVSDSDGEFHLLEEQLLRLIARMLDYELIGNRNEIKELLFEVDTDDILIALGSLDEQQKDWYIFTLAALIHADNKIRDEEMAYCKIYLEHMQITDERYNTVIQQSLSLANHFS